MTPRLALSLLGLLLPALSAAAEAHCEGTPPPTELVRALRTMVHASDPDPESAPDTGPLELSAARALRGGRSLLFVQVPDYLHQHSNTAVPVVLEADGRWRTGTPLEGRLVALVTAPDGALLAATQWQIEGTYPTLHRSRDGLAWTEVALPREASVGPMRLLTHLCHRNGRLVVAVSDEHGENPADRTWSRPSTGTAWTRRAKPAKGCLLASPAPKPRCRTEQADVFAIGRHAIALPRALALR